MSDYHNRELADLIEAEQMKRRPYRSPRATQIRGMIPSVVQTPTGWLAISPRTAPLNIAVVGGTADEARDCFRRSAEAWAQLHDAPEPELGQEDG